MSIKLKALGLGIVATMAMGAFAVMNATAETGGHFTSDQAHTTIIGSENTTHFSKLGIPGLKPIRCTTASYHGTTEKVTETQITITPSYANCETEGENKPGSVVVHMNGCDYRFTIGKKSEGENTADLVCPPEKFVDITHGDCTIKFPPQTNLLGVTYTTKTENSGKHNFTVDLSVKGATAHFEAGFCVLLGTKQAAELSGSVTVSGFTTEGAPVGITATGSEG